MTMTSLVIKVVR